MAKKDMENNKKDDQNSPNFDKKKLNSNYSQFYDEFDDNEVEIIPGKYQNIPPIIFKIWGRISEDKYFKLKNNSSWLDLTTRVCTDCFLSYTQMF